MEWVVSSVLTVLVGKGAASKHHRTLKNTADVRATKHRRLRYTPRLLKLLSVSSGFVSPLVVVTVTVRVQKKRLSGR